MPRMVTPCTPVARADSTRRARPSASSAPSAVKGVAMMWKMPDQLMATPGLYAPVLARDTRPEIGSDGGRVRSAAPGRSRDCRSAHGGCGRLRRLDRSEDDLRVDAPRHL